MKLIPLFVTFISITLGFSQSLAPQVDVIQNHIQKAQKYYENKLKDSAHYYTNKALQLAKQHPIDSIQIKVALVLSDYESDHKRVLEYFSKAEQLALENKYYGWLAKTYYKRGEYLYKKDNNKVAFNSFLKLDSISNRHKIDPYIVVRTKIRLAGLLFRIHNWSDAGQFPQIKKYINEGLKICDSFGLTEPSATLHLQNGVLNKFKRNYDAAIVAYNKAIKISKRNNDFISLAVVYNDVGSMYAYGLKQIDSAEANYLRAIETNKMHTDTLNLAEMNVQVANFYNIHTRHKEALKHLIIAQDLSYNRTDLRQEQRFKLNDVAANIYYALGNLDSAFSKSKEANRLFVEMTKIRNKENITELEAKYDNANKLNEIALLKSQNQLIEQQKRNQRNILFASLGIALLVAGFLFFLFRNRQKTNVKLKELDAFKTNLFTNISHELRTPLTLISGPIEKQLQDPNIPETIKQSLSLAQQNSNRLVDLVDQMTDLAKVESGQIKLQIVQDNLKLLLQQQLASFQYQAQEKQIQLNHTLELPKTVWFDKDILQKITSNLISNSLKYATEASLVTINATINNNMFEFLICNKTKLLKDRNLDELFNRFYQVNKSSKGMGVGLALVKQLVNLHKGHITINQPTDSTIEFKVQLPVYKDAFHNEEIIETLALALHPEETVQTVEPIIDEDAFVLLVVEDDPDIRMFVASIFKSTYQIIEAENGKEGIKIALEIIPDLIISDVMMPETDGITLTNTLKMDKRSSHIPIILLTAKVDEASKLEGIKVGADDYIAKPFKNELLKAKVDKLIKLRKQLQERFSQEIILRPADIAITSSEEQFLEKLQTVIDDKLIDPEFTTKEFSQSLGMSRMQLHRKLKALTGLTTSEFIRTQRLKLAADLLKNSDTIVSQVGYAVGFNDHSYFTRCFKKQFGCTPTQYARTN